MTAATGTTGRVVVDQLVAAGQHVRAVTRNPAYATFPVEAEVVGGDLDRPEELAFDGVDGVYYLPAVVDNGHTADRAAAFLELAAKAGVRRIVHLSGSAVAVRRAGSFEALLELAQLIEASWLEWTYVRPHELAVNKIDLWAHSVRTEGVIHNACPDGYGGQHRARQVRLDGVDARVDQPDDVGAFGQLPRLFQAQLADPERHRRKRGCDTESPPKTRIRVSSTTDKKRAVSDSVPSVTFARLHALDAVHVDVTSVHMRPHDPPRSTGEPGDYRPCPAVPNRSDQQRPRQDSNLRPRD